MFALISNDELEELGQIKVKQLKNRYNDPAVNRAFIIGVDRSKMRLYDVEQKAQEAISDSGNEEEYHNSTSEKFKSKKTFRTVVNSCPVVISEGMNPNFKNNTVIAKLSPPPIIASLLMTISYTKVRQQIVISDRLTIGRRLPTVSASENGNN